MAYASQHNVTAEQKLAAANARIAELEAEVLNTSQAVFDVAKERDELTAHCERLREALTLCSSFIGDAAGFDPYGSEKDLAEFLQRVKREELKAAAQAKEALSSTPPLSLAKHDAELLRKIAEDFALYEATYLRNMADELESGEKKHD